ncbi:unnamed protein product [Sphacelaria rigidula]
MLRDILSLGPTSLICEYDGGCNYSYLGTLSRSVRATWALSTTTALSCVTTSTARLAELPTGPFRTKCLIQGLVHAVDAQEWDIVQWIVPRLPKKYALYTDKLSSAVLETGVVSAIKYAISITETKTARPIFRVAPVNAVCKYHSDAAKHLCTRFADSTLRKNVALAACLEGNTALIQWCAETMHAFPTECVRALAYKGNVDALEWLRANSKASDLISDQLVLYAALGGHVQALDWVLDNNPGIMFDAEEVCLMVCTKGMLNVLKHLVVMRGFRLKMAACTRFAKRGSGVAG